MEIKLFDASDIKERFALLIAKLHDAGFLLDYINEVMVKSSFFDCFDHLKLIIIYPLIILDNFF